MKTKHIIFSTFAYLSTLFYFVLEGYILYSNLINPQLVISDNTIPINSTDIIELVLVLLPLLICIFIYVIGEEEFQDQFKSIAFMPSLTFIILAMVLNITPTVKKIDIYLDDSMSIITSKISLNDRNLGVFKDSVNSSSIDSIKVFHIEKGKQLIAEKEALQLASQNAH